MGYGMASASSMEVSDDNFVKLKPSLRQAILARRNKVEREKEAEGAGAGIIQVSVAKAVSVVMKKAKDSDAVILLVLDWQYVSSCQFHDVLVKSCTEAYQEIESATLSLGECITGIFNYSAMQEEIAEASPEGELDAVFNNHFTSARESLI
uniref:Uncharacterized protein n=1 Tax=Glossina morsitans morsitans TaxID=37546 RepID=A0A1B0G1I5_GLOMM